MRRILLFVFTLATLATLAVEVKEPAVTAAEKDQIIKTFAKASLKAVQLDAAQAEFNAAKAEYEQAVASAIKAHQWPDKTVVAVANLDKEIVTVTLPQPEPKKVPAPVEPPKK